MRGLVDHHAVPTAMHSWPRFRISMARAFSPQASMRHQVRLPRAQLLQFGRKPGIRDCDPLDKVCETGRLGQKTGPGWYRYESGSRTPIPDPVIEQLIVEHSDHAGIARRDISAWEILDRCLYAMSNEGAKILEEGMAARPVDIDTVWLHGFGSPAWRSGSTF